MRNMKKFVTGFLAVMMVFSMVFVTGVTVSAADNSTIQITKKDGDKVSARTYAAYQIFEGSYDATTKKLAVTGWADGVNSANLMTALNKLSYFDSLPASPTANDYANIMMNNNGDNAFKEALVSCIEKNVEKAEAKTSVATGSTYSITGLSDGYYLVLETTASGAEINKDTRSRGLLVVTGGDTTTTVAPKSNLPRIEKKILEDGQLKDANELSVGDNVTYRLKSKVPNMEGYEKYYFIVKDTMTKGLTFQPSTVKISIGGTQLGTGAYDVYHETDAATGVTSIKIVFKNFIQYRATNSGDDIEIEYEATLNSEADITSTNISEGGGNINKASLVYSNDPSYEYKGKHMDNGTPGNPADDYTDPDQPEDDPNDDPSLEKDPIGETPEDLVVTYSTSLRILKVDGLDNTPLDGVTFQLKQDTGGTYNKTLTTAGGGLLTFEGVGAGDYTLTETATKAGYNMIAPIKLKITADIDSTNLTLLQVDWDETAIDEVHYNVDQDVRAIEIVVKNNQGAVLPTTGGIGTTIFYVLGGLLVCGAAVLLITRKRMSMQDK